jgi:hypothetical protein
VSGSDLLTVPIPSVNFGARSLMGPPIPAVPVPSG